MKLREIKIIGCRRIKIFTETTAVSVRDVVVRADCT